MAKNPYAGSTDPNDISASRDANSDAGRGGEQYKGRGPYQGTDFQAQTLQQEADQEGWTNTTRPTGAPSDATTAGTRGAADENVGDKDSPSNSVSRPG